jgi:ABC-2 type transport system permease protein
VQLSMVLVPLVVLATTLFCGVGAVLGRVSDSRDGVVAASNTIALPLLFLSETFVPPEMLPAWFRPAIDLSPVTYFARGVRAVTYTGGEWTTALAILAVLAVIGFLAGAVAIPRTD